MGGLSQRRLGDLFVGNDSSGDNRYPCQLFHNNHDRTFTDVARACGVAIVGFVNGGIWGDYNNAGRPDLFLSCFGQPNRLFRNAGA